MRSQNKEHLIKETKWIAVKLINRGFLFVQLLQREGSSITKTGVRRGLCVVVEEEEEEEEGLIFDSGALYIYLLPFAKKNRTDTTRPAQRVYSLIQRRGSVVTWQKKEPGCVIYKEKSDFTSRLLIVSCSVAYSVETEVLRMCTRLTIGRSLEISKHGKSFH